MAEYIDRDVFKAKYLCCGWLDEMSEEEFDRFPAANVAPVAHGMWLGQSGLFQGKCSVCGYMIFEKTADWVRAYWSYCPKCGAKMDGK